VRIEIANELLVTSFCFLFLFLKFRHEKQRSKFNSVSDVGGVS